VPSKLFCPEKKNNLANSWSICYFKSDSHFTTGPSPTLCWATQHGYAANDFAHGSDNSRISGYFCYFSFIPFVNMWIESFSSKNSMNSHLSSCLYFYYFSCKYACHCSRVLTTHGNIIIAARSTELTATELF
jgi:hypothetical protein